ncbi:hypothetical protein LRO89_01025 [Priestia megaterium]|uniref:hypothetical protein n=1 Tax=Priestia megaterium TaxID=1404 RepID=UPI0039C21625
MQNAATAPGNGTTFTAKNGNATLSFEITGTSTSRTILFQIAGPSGVYVPITVYSVNDPSKMVQQTTGGSNDVPEHWLVQVPDGWTFRTKITSVTGGNVSILGRAVT